ncbi:cytochrome b [Sulfuriferula thiophila]|uniref:cytochrome b n=1 Tax=Sulfuriferula thiophila TaxID=1781211 RepID=UPI000F60C5B3|nr:cytochrome b [Sulfuriferula thiophila]
MSTRYTHTAIVLHWLIAAMIVMTFPLGLYMSDLSLSPFKLQLYAYHKWIGIVVLMLVVLRLLWRVTHRPPAMVAGMPRWQQLAAQGVHLGLYGLMLAVPLTGWLMSSALGFQVVLFGVLPLPDLIAANKAVGQQLKEVHELLNYGLLAMVVVHIGAALQHHFIHRDSTLTRMAPWLGERK